MKASVTDPSVVELYLLDYLVDGWKYDWSSDTFTETNWVADVVAKVKAANPARILLTIDSMGGDALIGLALYNFLKNYNAKVEVDIIGFCASAATLPAMAASKGKLRMARNSFMIIHEAWMGTAGGRSSDLREQAEYVDKITRQYVDIYAVRTGMSADAIAALIEPGDYWMDGQEAVAAGFADEIYNDVPAIPVQARVSASFEALGFRNIPKTLKAGAADVSAAVESPSAEVDAPLPGLIDSLNNLFMDLKGKIGALFNKGAQKPSAAVTAPAAKPETTPAETPATDEAIRAQVMAAMEQPMADFAAAVEEEVSKELTASEQRITAAVTASLSAKYDAEIKALKDENEELNKEVSASVGGPTQEKGTGAAPKASIGFFKKG